MPLLASRIRPHPEETVTPYTAPPVPPAGAGPIYPPGGPAGFANNWNLSTKQNSSAAVLTFNNLILTNYGVLHNTGTGASSIGLAGNLMVTNGGGTLSPGDGNIVVYSTVTGAGPLWIGDPVAPCSYGVIFAGSISNFTGNIFATNLTAQLSAAPAMVPTNQSIPCFTEPPTDVWVTTMAVNTAQ